MVPQFGIAKLVNISPISLGLIRGLYIYRQLMRIINQLITGGHHLVPYIRPIFQGYVREYPLKIWSYIVLTYLHFRILKFPLIYEANIV